MTTEPSSTSGSAPGTAEAAERLRARLRGDLATQLSARLRTDDDADRPAIPADERRRLAHSILAGSAEKQAQHELDTGGAVVTHVTEQQIIASVLDEFFGLGGLEPLLANPAVETININGADRVFVRYADGARQRLPSIVGADHELIELIRDLAARSGVEERRFDRGSPIVNFALPGGERVSAIMTITERPGVSIRRHRFQRVSLAELREKGTLDRALESFLSALVRARKNVLITGGTAIGKTTLLRAMAGAIPPVERVLTIEDVFELGLSRDAVAHPDAMAMQAREANVEGQGALTQSDLVWQSLRMTPDRVIVGEVRGPEVIPLINSMSMGNDGSMGTLHTSSSSGAFTKLAAYAVQGPERLPLEATNLLVASALHFVVHMAKPRDDRTQRVVSSVREVVGADGQHVVSNEVWRPGVNLRAVPGVPLRTDTMDDLIEAGFDAGLLDRGDGWWAP